MTSADWSLIPSPLLRSKSTGALVEWLRTRGLQMSLLDLNAERRKRGITPPSRNN